MTNGELIQACAGQCCARCDYHSECETFKRIYDRLPEELGFIAKKEGATAEVTLNLSIPIDEDWLNTEMSITLVKALVHSEIDKLADEENRIRWYKRLIDELLPSFAFRKHRTAEEQ